MYLRVGLTTLGAAIGIWGGSLLFGKIPAWVVPSLVASVFLLAIADVFYDRLGEILRLLQLRLSKSEEEMDQQMELEEEIDKKHFGSCRNLPTRR